MKYINKIIKTLFIFSCLIITIFSAPTNAKAIEREGGDLIYQTTASSAGSNGWLFSTVGWTYHLTTNNGMANVYVPLSELLEYLPMNI